MFSDRNPIMPMLHEAAERVAKERKPIKGPNPFIALERLMAASVMMGFDLMRDTRDALFESTFLSLYGSPWMHWIGRSHSFQRTHRDAKEMRFLPEVQSVLRRIDRGGFEEGVIRMLVLLAEARGSVRRDRLERSAKVLTKDEPFASLGAEQRAAIIREQSIICEFEKERAIETLPNLLPGAADRRKALGVVEFIAGAWDEMEPHSLKTLQRFYSVLGEPLVPTTPVESPLGASSGEEAA
jgi:tellurite resistance protein